MGDERESRKMFYENVDSRNAPERTRNLHIVLLKATDLMFAWKIQLWCFLALKKKKNLIEHQAQVIYNNYKVTENKISLDTL